MKLSDILVRDACVLEMRARIKPEALAELAGALVAAVPGLEREALLAMLLERERLGTTALGGGIAIPHARLEPAGRLFASFGRSRAGVDFDSVDGAPTHLFFVLVAPGRAGSAHLAALARLSLLLGSESFRKQLETVASTDELLRALAQQEAGA
jgi:PTS system nitrogen regulatory IIA component